MRASLLVIAALTFAACGGQAIHGTYMLQAQNVAYSGGSCSGVGRFADLHDGTVVNVLDGAGTIIGTGKLVVDPARSSNDGCQYTFDIGIASAGIYQVVVGSRTPQSYSADELKAVNYKITLYSPGAGG